MLSQLVESKTKLRAGEARYTITVKLWDGTEFVVTVRGYNETQAAARALNSYQAKTVKVSVSHAGAVERWGACSCEDADNNHRPYGDCPVRAPYVQPSAR